MNFCARTSGIFFLTLTLIGRPDHTHTITPGIGTKEIFVGQRIQEVFALLGKNDKYTEGIIDYVNREARHINRYYFTKLGLIFITKTDESKGEDTANAKVDMLIFRSPAIARTDSNIVLGKDTREKIFSTMGRPDADKDIYSDVTYIHYRSKGISFEIDDSTQKISAIEVYKQNRYPEVIMY